MVTFRLKAINLHADCQFVTVVGRKMVHVPASMNVLTEHVIDIKEFVFFADFFVDLRNEVV